MKAKYFSFVIFILLSLVSFVGCATTDNTQIMRLESKMSDLEERIESVEEDQGNLEDKIDEQLTIKAESDISVDSSAASVSIPETPSNKDMQIALKNAGLYDGDIDGKIGPKTRNAVMEFQKQNDLQVDGVVGKNTWETLSRFYTQTTEEK